MDRMTTAVICGRNHELNYSIEVMFNMREKFGTIQNALDIISQDDMPSFEATRWFAMQMANDAELCRREAGYDHQPMLTEQDISLRMSPLEYEELKGSVVQAIILGYKRELEDGDEETDIGLEELRAKKAEAGE